MTPERICRNKDYELGNFLLLEEVYNDDVSQVYNIRKSSFHWLVRQIVTSAPIRAWKRTPPLGNHDRYK